MRNQIMAAAILAMASTASVSSQTPPSHRSPAAMEQRHMDRLGTALGLTEAQKTRASAIFAAVRPASPGSRTAMRQAHQILNAAIEKNDPVAIDQAAAQIGTMMAQQTAAQAKAEAAFRQILTPEQLTRYEAMRAEHGGFGHGFGGPPPGNLQ